MLKKLTQWLHSWIKVCVIAVAFAFVKILSAFGTKSLAVLMAKEAHGELHFKLLEQLFIHIKESVLDYSELIKLIFIKITNDTNEGRMIEIPAGTGFAQGIFVEYGITFDDDADGVRNGGFGSTT